MSEEKEIDVAVETEITIPPMWFIGNVSPLSLIAGSVTYSNITINGGGFSTEFYKNRVSLIFVKDLQNEISSVNVSVLEPNATSGSDVLIVQVKAKLAVLAELVGKTGNDRKFAPMVDILADDGSVFKKLIGNPSTYIEFFKAKT
jgi:hypothetical protein